MRHLLIHFRLRQPPINVMNLVSEKLLVRQDGHLTAIALTIPNILKNVSARTLAPEDIRKKPAAPVQLPPIV